MDNEYQTQDQSDPNAATQSGGYAEHDAAAQEIQHTAETQSEPLPEVTTDTVLDASGFSKAEIEKAALAENAGSAPATTEDTLVKQVAALTVRVSDLEQTVSSLNAAHAAVASAVSAVLPTDEENDKHSERLTFIDKLMAHFAGKL